MATYLMVLHSIGNYAVGQSVDDPSEIERLERDFPRHVAKHTAPEAELAPASPVKTVDEAEATPSDSGEQI